jgi:methylthioribose-1-phosphate isomerase
MDAPIRSIEWLGSRVRLIDQTKLPLRELYLETADYRVVAEAIRTLGIRGAPAIGIAAAYGIALAGLASGACELGAFLADIRKASGELASTRPTAVNLFLALKRMDAVAAGAPSADEARSLLVEEALSIHREDEAMCRLIGEHGAALVPDPAVILTHCNTGALATGGSGTAQSVITTARAQGKSIRVYADETRPALQGARLTAWELMRAGVDVTLITDGTAPFVMRRNRVDLVVVGADRIAANGDSANKVGTYALAVAARHHGIPFYIAAPTTTIDPELATGDLIPIEERSASEVTEGFGTRTAPEGVRVYAPAFDVTPAPLIAAIVTEAGVQRPPYHFTRPKGDGRPGAR